MTGRCGNCGAELFAGQQYCRQCGAATVTLEGEAPTQVLPGARPPSASDFGTVALPSRETGEPSLASFPTDRQLPFGRAAYTAPLASAASGSLARTTPSRSWLKPVLICLLVIGVIGGLLAVSTLTSTLLRKQVMVIDRSVHTASANENLLDESGAIVSGGETVLTKAFDVNQAATISIKNTQGNVTVEGWDGNRVEVKVIKRGGSVEEQSEAHVALKQSPELFSLSPTTNESSSVKIFFEVKLPREAANIELASNDGNVKASALKAPLTINVRNGTINLDDVSGVVEAKSVNGKIDVAYKSAERSGAQEFKTVNGNINLHLVDGMNADVKASVVNGSIDVADGLGLQPQKRQVGWQLDSQLGKGGELMNVKTVNGTIKFEK